MNTKIITFILLGLTTILSVCGKITVDTHLLATYLVIVIIILFLIAAKLDGKE